MELSLKVDPTVANWAILASIIVVGAVALLVANAKRPLFPHAAATPGGEA